MSHKYVTRKLPWSEAKELSRALRSEVFIDEQQVPKDIEWDGRDEECIHVITTLEDMPVATGRLMPDGKIGRLAVKSNQRGKGLGDTTLCTLIEEARQLGLLRVYLYAQVSAQAFYQKAGFKPYGEVFVEAGIDHQAMSLLLEPQQIKLKYEQVIKNIDLFAARARNQLKIEIPCEQLALIFDEDLRRELTIMLRDNARLQLSILTWDDADLAQQAPLLIEWLQRLSSRVELRVLERGTFAYRSLLVSAWPTGGIMQENEVYHQFPCNSPKMRIVDEEFDRRWAAAKISSHLRRI